MMKVNIPKDKLKHLLACLVISFIVSTEYGPLWGLVAGNLAGLLKDFVWDLLLGKGKFEWADIAHSGLGTGIGVLLWIGIAKGI
jgi:hypothetical protein